VQVCAKHHPGSVKSIIPVEEFEFMVIEYCEIDIVAGV
jgi:hypothetical protein